ncbi:MAG: Hint domain-containing protein [Pseudomonadota bacterium]|nr:Hint domain-containing protein [Pseudomonadota bacterium]
MGIWDKVTGAPGAGRGKAWPDHGPDGKPGWGKDDPFGPDHGWQGKGPDGKPGGFGKGHDHDRGYDGGHDHGKHGGDDVHYGPGWKDRDDDHGWGWKDRDDRHDHDRDRDHGWGWKDRDDRHDHDRDRDHGWGGKDRDDRHDHDRDRDHGWGGKDRDDRHDHDRGHDHGWGWKDRDDRHDHDRDRDHGWGGKDRDDRHDHDHGHDHGGRDRDDDRHDWGRDKPWWDKGDHGGKHGHGHGHGGGRDKDHHWPPHGDKDPDKDTCPPVPCFTPGTTIVTDRGLVRVEDLKVGDLVVTRDDGLQPIRWIGRRDMFQSDLVGDARLRPIRIRAGALGQGLPARDMMVSPQHRVLLADRNVALMFQEAEMLAPAMLLLGRDGVERMGTAPVTYIHIMFDRHQVVLSDHIWTESFQPGQDVVDTMEVAQRDELYTLFPALAGQPIETVYPAARSTLKGYEAKALKLAV